MAEGGSFSSSIQEGSDFQYDLCCTPCNEDNIKEEAIKYCPECQEYLCTTCTRHHGRQKATRSHQLVDKDAAKRTSDRPDCKSVIKAKCRYHLDRDIEIYCGTHDMVYCALCIAIEHRSCDGVNKVDDAAISECVDNVDLLLAEINSVHEKLVSATKQREENLRSIDEQKGTVNVCIQTAKRKLLERLDTLERNSIDLLQERFVEIKDGLESDVSMLQITRTEVEKILSTCKSMSKTDAEQRFVNKKLSKRIMTDAENVLAECESNGIKAMIFEENEELHTSILKTETFGNINSLTTTNKEEKMTQGPLKMKSKTGISVRMQTDQIQCFITGICVLHDDTIVLADYSNKKLKAFDMSYKRKSDCSVGINPLGVCCAGKNELAVKLWNKVLFISASTSLTKVREMQVSCGWYYGISYQAGELWLTTGTGVDIYNTAGSLLKSVRADLNGHKIFKSTTQYMGVSGECVIVADWSDGAVCVGSDAMVKRELRDQSLTNSSGICVTDNGMVLVAGYGSNNIVMFQENGKCLGELVSKDVGLNMIQSLCYIKKTNTVIVACQSSDLAYAVELTR